MSTIEILIWVEIAKAVILGLKGTYAVALGHFTFNIKVVGLVGHHLDKNTSHHLNFNIFCQFSFANPNFLMIDSFFH